TFGGIIRDTLGAGSSTVGLALTTGTLTLSGANLFTGGTAVNGGTLIVTGSLSAGNTTTINTGATLSGTGNAGGVALSGGSIKPGATAADASIGTLNMSSLTVNSGDLRLDTVNSSNNDKIVVSGTANFAGS